MKHELKKLSAKDPSNPHRTKWGYYAYLKKGKFYNWYRVSKNDYFKLKYGKESHIKGMGVVE